MNAQKKTEAVRQRKTPAKQIESADCNCGETEQIAATFFGKGKMHDCRLFYLSCVRVGKQTKLRADLGYWVLQTQLWNVILPQKTANCIN